MQTYIGAALCLLWNETPQALSLLGKLTLRHFSFNRIKVLKRTFNGMTKGKNYLTVIQVEVFAELLKKTVIQSVFSHRRHYNIDKDALASAVSRLLVSPSDPSSADDDDDDTE